MANNNNQTQPLEPRVAKLETGLEMLTRDVASLANIVREQGSGIEEQIKQLAIGVTQAAGPRRTDWGTLIAALMLVMAIGSAVFWPLNQTAQNNKEEVRMLLNEMNDHQQLQLHPVGAALLGRVEDQLKTHIDNNSKELKSLDEKLQREYELKHNALEDKFQLYVDKLFGRVLTLEQAREIEHQKDLDELRQWRNKANGLSSPDSVVPLRPRENGVK